MGRQLQTMHMIKQCQMAIVLFFVHPIGIIVIIIIIKMVN